MFELVGNFDAQHDAFDGEQRAAAIAVTADVLRVFGLTTDAVRFHRDLNHGEEVVPRYGIDRKTFVADVSAAIGALVGAKRGARSRSAPPKATRLFALEFLLGFDVTAAAAPSVDLSTATVPEHGAGAAEVDRAARAEVATVQRALRYSRDCRACLPRRRRAATTGAC